MGANGSRPAGGLSDRRIRAWGRSPSAGAHLLMGRNFFPPGGVLFGTYPEGVKNTSCRPRPLQACLGRLGVAVYACPLHPKGGPPDLGVERTATRRSWTPSDPEVFCLTPEGGV